jgi:EAL domain-containing protein (putative c-di-GMP-specific phosphodiesterase class I)/GGDEF domain-containing protein
VIQVKVTDMSLMRQIGLLLAAVLLLALAGAVGVNLLSARETLEAQLRVKNSDNAQSLALALSQQRGDAQLMALLMTAQFDTGFYRRIRLVDGDGKVAFERQAQSSALAAPAWFAAAWPIESPPGVAQVSDGWRAVGRVELVSQVAYAHDELWRGSVRAALLLAAIGALALALAAAGVRRIRRPLDATVAQAQSLEGGHYVMVDEPRVPELRRVARAMNSMVQRVKSLFEAQAAQVETLRRQAHEDPLTGLAHRGHFMQRLAALLHGEDGAAGGTLVLARVADVAGLNRHLGREATDRALCALADVLRTTAGEQAVTGRLNGADFALAVAAPAHAAETAAALCQRLQLALAPFGEAVAVHVGAIDWQRDAIAGALLTQADLALARAESGPPFTAQVAGIATSAMTGEHGWHQQLSRAMSEQRTRLVSYPVLARDGRLWQLECPLRVQCTPGGDYETAAQWLPLAARSRLLPQLDLHAVQLALAAIAADGVPRGINLALASLADGAFTTQLRRLLDSAPRACAQLSLEVGEGAALEHFALMQAFSALVRPLGVRFGLEHAGHRLHRVERLYELGLDYVKLDAALVRGVAGDQAARRFVQGSVTLLRALAISVCAEGVDDAADAQALWACGVDAITGPWASAQRPSAA